MVPLGAEILTEIVSSNGRGAVRRTLSLGVQAHSAGDIAMALVLNLSETGLLLESVVKLEVGETLFVDIPEAKGSAVRIVWTDGLLAGCEFVRPLSGGAMSAAQLKASIGVAMTQPKLGAGRSDRRTRPDDYEREDAGFERTLVMISAVIAVTALIIFLAAIVPL